jgi:predicted TIM-barrel fold metal-dependent hydrolase
MITSTRYDPTYSKAYTKLYRAIEERNLPLGFHSSYNFGDRAMSQFNRFISVHTIGFPVHHMIQATNWIVNGLPERFPNLKVIFIEGGLAWVPFIMQRLDHEFLMRPSEAPLLTRRPSEYMQEFFYTTQPLEVSHPRLLKETLQMIGDTQLLWASDWPHWDWDPPHKIWDMPFLSEEAKRNILGENARKLLRLP